MDDIQTLLQSLEQIKIDAAAKTLELQKIQREINTQHKNLEAVSDTISEKLGNVLEKTKFLEFFKKPYLVWPNGKDKILVFVPKFIRGFQVGWLLKEDDNFFVYQLDQYSAWLGDVPTDLLKQINFEKKIEGTIEGNQLYFDATMKDVVKKRLGTHLAEVSENQARIKIGHAFDVLAEMIESGCLPFKPRKVLEADKRESKAKIELRSYQKPAVKKFMETGAIGLFHPTGAGKSIVTMHLIDTIKGNKLLVVPTKTLAEQWGFYIEQYIPHCKDEIRITTYQGWRDNGDEYTLVIYDECQRLPADTFSRLSVIKTKYRIGLSASPHREDGRESYIFALTGFPVGLNWRDYMETVGKAYYPINVHLVKHSYQKIVKMASLLDTSKKTLIFCDTIELGKQISKQFGVPYVYGESSDRLETIESNKVTAISRVGDLGVSIKDLQRIIEIDFLFGSRQQELQRTGRLMHSEQKDLKHDIIMTEAEFSQHGKRLWALREKGFNIRVLENGN